MDIEKYFTKKKELTRKILMIYNEENNRDEEANELNEYIRKEKIGENLEELRIFLRIFSRIIMNHHRTKNVINKIKQILSPLIDNIKESFSNIEIFNFFQNNKFILLILLEMNILSMEEQIITILRWKIDTNNTKFCHFFYPELKDHLEEKDRRNIEEELKEIDSDIFNNFSAKRQEGENDSYICQLIRQDSIIEFITYVNKNNTYLDSKINHSIFETNSFLIEKSPTLIEYSAFCGSIEIFQYLRLNGAEMNPELWLYAIHSNNPTIIHLLEEFNHISNMSNVINESIKCHHNEITDYLLDMFSHDKQKLLDYCFLHDNFVYLPNIFYENDQNKICEKLCEFNCFGLFQSYLNENQNNIILYSIFKVASKISSTDIINYLLLKVQINELDFRNNTKLTNIDFAFSKARNECYFCFCTSLTYVKLPSSIMRIDKNAFCGCFSLTKVIIPSSIISINNYAFDNCYSLKEVIFDENVLSNNLNSFYHSYECSINHMAFRNCRSLKEIKIPPNITKIKEYAFENCTSLTNISFHQSVIFIGSNAFANCPNIKIDELEIPSSLKNIGFNTFSVDESLAEESKLFIIYDIPAINDAKILYDTYFSNILNNFCDIYLLPNADLSTNEKIAAIEYKTPHKVDEFESIIKKDPKTNIFNVAPTSDIDGFYY